MDAHAAPAPAPAAAMDASGATPAASPPAAPEGDADADLAAASAAEALPARKSDLPVAVPPVEGAPSVGKENAVAAADGLPPLTKEEMIEKALACPCIAGMKEGPCGSVFLEAYKCFLRSETEPQGMDCMEHFVAIHSCMGEHPDEYDLDDDDDPFARGKGEGKAGDQPKEAPVKEKRAKKADAPVVEKAPATTEAVGDAERVAEEHAAEPAAAKAEHAAAPAAVAPSSQTSADSSPGSPTAGDPAPVAETPPAASPPRPIAATSPREAPAVLLCVRALYSRFFGAPQ